jgi:hypothetical protein
MLEDLEGLRMPAITQRPATMGDDWSVWRALLAHRKQGDRVNKADLEITRDLRAWRDDVLRQEQAAMSRLGTLLRALHTFELTGRHDAETSRLKLFMFEQYGLRMAERVPEDAGRALADLQVQSTSTLPHWVRAGTKPPGVVAPPSED